MARKGRIIIKLGSRMAISTIISTMTELRQECYHFEVSMDKEGRNKKREG